jgi:hypothetical protein
MTCNPEDRCAICEGRVCACGMTEQSCPCWEDDEWLCEACDTFNPPCLDTCENCSEARP